MQNTQWPRRRRHGRRQFRVQSARTHEINEPETKANFEKEEDWRRTKITINKLDLIQHLFFSFVVFSVALCRCCPGHYCCPASVCKLARDSFFLLFTYLPHFCCCCFCLSQMQFNPQICNRHGYLSQIAANGHCSTHEAKKIINARPTSKV